MILAMSDVDISYVIRFEEVAWGIALIAVTMVLHAFGMTGTLLVCAFMRQWSEGSRPFLRGIAVLILASWMIIVVHLLEVFVWSAFLHWKGAISQAGRGVYFYFSLNEYTTVGSNFNLDQRWRLLEGMLATAGLLSFAWSTGVLLTLAQAFQDRQVERLLSLRKRHAPDKKS